jgi:hypothetical protein
MSETVLITDHLLPNYRDGQARVFGTELNWYVVRFGTPPLLDAEPMAYRLNCWLYYNWLTEEWDWSYRHLGEALLGCFIIDNRARADAQAEAWNTWWALGAGNAE